MPSPILKSIVCLANSRKLSGRCVAGKEIFADGSVGEWIRPVSDRPSEEVSEHERQYEDGSEPRVLDLIDVPLLKSSPKTYQQENWLLDPNYYWEKVRRISWAELPRMADNVRSLWTNGPSSSNGSNDRIPLLDSYSLSSSLYLIRLPNLELVVSAPGAAFGNHNRRVQGRFRYNGIDYWLRVTDPQYEREYLRKPNGSYHIEDCFLTISLGEPFQGYAYKLIAAIITQR